MTGSRLQPDLQRVADAIERAVDGLTSEQLAWCPEGKWSAANILEHVSLCWSFARPDYK